MTSQQVSASPRYQSTRCRRPRDVATGAQGASGLEIAPAVDGGGCKGGRQRGWDNV